MFLRAGGGGRPAKQQNGEKCSGINNSPDWCQKEKEKPPNRLLRPGEDLDQRIQRAKPLGVFGGEVRKRG